MCANYSCRKLTASPCWLSFINYSTKKLKIIFSHSSAVKIFFSLNFPLRLDTLIKCFRHTNEENFCYFSSTQKISISRKNINPANKLSRQTCDRLCRLLNTNWSSCKKSAVKFHSEIECCRVLNVIAWAERLKIVTPRRDKRGFMATQKCHDKW